MLGPVFDDRSGDVDCIAAMVALQKQRNAASAIAATGQVRFVPIPGIQAELDHAAPPQARLEYILKDTVRFIDGRLGSTKRSNLWAALARSIVDAT